MFKQMMVHMLLTPLYWLGAYFIPQYFAYAISVVATFQMLMSIRYYLQFKNEQERALAELLANAERLL